MKFFKIKYNYLLLSIFAILFLTVPITASAAKFGCIVNGVCQEIEQPDESTARTACGTYCRTFNAVGISGDKTCTFTPRCIAPTANPAGAPASNGCEIVNGKEVCKLTNPLCRKDSNGNCISDVTEVSVIISIVIQTLLGIIGGLTLLMFVYGGFQWLTSAGNPEKVKSGTQTMVWSVIGVMLVLASYLLLSTFLDFLTGKAT